MTGLETMGMKAKQAAALLGCATTEQKNRALALIAEKLSKEKELWLEANSKDTEAATQKGISAALLDRLTLTQKRIDSIASSIAEVIALEDPVGRIISSDTRPNGLVIQKKSVPLGVIAIIFEARPNVVVDAAVLCLKAGSACILRGGKEAINSNIAAVKIMRSALAESGLPEDCICLVEDTTHESSRELMHLNQYVDVLIPRGGASLIRAVTKEASVPVIRTGEGICHIYIDKNADLKMGADVLFNAKCSRPSVCNAAECLLVHRDVLKPFLEAAVPLLDTKNVELRCDEASLKVLGNRAVKATEQDWDSEYNDFILAVKTVESAQEAIDFINAHGSGHSEAVITSDEAVAQKFLNEVDAAAVYVNASTRFTDGGEFGLGAEIGISIQKMHARGPMGLNEITSYKYVVRGNGQVR